MKKKGIFAILLLIIAITTVIPTTMAIYREQVNKKVTLNIQNSTYRVVFNGNGNDGGSTNYVDCEYNTNCTLTANGFTKDGYYFGGWATSSNGEAIYEDEEVVQNLAITGIYNLYAIWVDDFTSSNYTITYNYGTLSFDGTNYLNTNLPLFSSTNYDVTNHDYKDFSINFDVTDYSLSSQPQNPATYVTIQEEDDADHYRGFIYRWQSSTKTNFKIYLNKDANTYSTDFSGAANMPSSVEIKRVDNYLYFNDTLADRDLDTIYGNFDKPLLFGASYKQGSYYRYGKSTLSNISVSLEYDNTNAVTLPNPVLSGTSCVFLGWTTANDNTLHTTVTVPARNIINKSYIANFDCSGNYNLVTYDAGTGGEISETTKYVASNQAIGTLLTPTKIGHTFDGWYLESTYDTEIDDTYVPTGDTTLYAKWTINQYTITFNTDGGSTIESITADYDTAITPPANPTKEGFRFTGWSPAIPATMPAENMTIVAQWISDSVTQYRITFNPGTGATVSEAFRDVEIEDEIGELPVPTKEGYRFLGWYLEATFDTEVDDTYVPTGNITLYADWEEITEYKVIYNYGDISFDGTNYLNTNIALFSNENKDKDFEIDVASISNSTFKTARDIWNSIIANMNEGGSPYQGFVFRRQSGANTFVVVANTTGSIKGTTAESGMPSSINLKRENNIFYVDDTQLVDFSGIAPFNTTLTFGTNLNGSGNPDNRYSIIDLEGINVSITYPKTSAVTLVAPSFEGSGCTFEGWTGSNGNTPQLNVTIPVGNIEDKTYNAIFSCVHHTITFNAGDGTLSEATRSVKDGDAIGTLPTPTMTGYTFDGWFLESTYNTEVDATYIPTGNAELYAKWTANQYTITFNTDGGNEITTITADYGTAITAPTNPTKEGYRFIGWNPELPATMPAENLTVTAKWRSNNLFEITYNFGELEFTGSNYLDTKLELFSNTYVSNDFDISLDITSSEFLTGQDSNMNSIIAIMDESGQPYPGIVFRRNASKFQVAANSNSSNKYEKDYTGTSIDLKRESSKLYLNDSEILDFNALAKTFTVPLTIGASIKNNNPFRYSKGTLSNIKVSVIYSTENAVTLPNPTFGDCIFTGWTGSNGNTPQTNVTVPAGAVEDKTYTANFSCNYNTVTFNANDGTVSEATRNVEYEHAIGTLPIPTKEGYTFNGWYVNSDFTGSPIDATYVPTADTPLYAKWTINQYTITFNTDGGSTIESITADYGTAITPPADPTKTDYTFTGWSPAVPATMPATNMTVVAQWSSSTSAEYTITYNYGNKSFDGTTFLNTNLPLFSEANYNKTSHVYKDFEIDFSVNGSLDKPSGSSDDQAVLATCMNERDSTNYPGFTYRYYPASTKTNFSTYVKGGTGKDSKDFIGANIPTNVKIERIDNFMYINDSKNNTDFDNIVANFDNMFLIFGAGYKSDGTNRRYLVGELDNIVVKLEYDNATAVTLPNPVFENSGCTFTGWTGDNGNTPETTVTVPSGNTTNKTYTANFSCPVSAYTVTFNLNGGTMSEPTTKDVTVGSAIGTLPTPTKANSTFMGWYVNSNFTGSAIDASYVPSADTPLYAKWDDNQYTITFNANGGTASEATRNVEKTSAIGTLPTATKEGHTFDGWYVNSDFTGSAIDATYVPEASIPLYAKWTINQYTIIFNTDGGSTIESITADYGTAITAPTNPTKSGFTFLGWNPAIPATMPATNTTVVAQWRDNSLGIYTITYNYGNKTFDGTNYLNTGLELFSATNYDLTNHVYKDFEINFTKGAIGSNNSDKADLVSCFYKADSKYPGFIYRYRSTPSYELATYINGPATGGTKYYASSDTNVTISRIDNYIYLNGVQTEHDFDDMHANFTYPLLFGAEFTNTSYNVIQKGYKGEINNIEVSLEYDNTNAVTLPTPDYAGCRFTGWTGDNGNTPQATVTVAANNTTDLNYTANFDCSHYEVTFNANGGNVNETTRDVVIGSAIGTLPTPTKTGHTFVAWHLGSVSGNVVDAIYIPEGNVELVAEWSVNQYTITLKDEEDTISTITADYGASITQPATPSKEGYTFVEWIPAIPATMPANNMTVVAVWRENNATEYKITYDYGDLTFDGTMYYNTGLELFSSTHVLNDFEISLSYANNVYVTEQSNNLNNILSIMDESGAGNVWPGIVWRRNATGYTLVANASSSVKKEQGYSTSSINLKRTSQKLYLNDATSAFVDFTNIVRTFDVPLTFGAGLNGSLSPFRYFKGDLNDIVVSLIYSNGSAVTLPTPSFVGSECAFIGWTGSNGDTPETTVTIPSGNVQDKTYTANFQCTTNRITFVANGGTASESSRFVPVENAIGTLPTATRYGYMFGGWYADDTLQTEVTSSYVPTSNKTLYAKWVKSVDSMVFNDTTEYLVLNDTKQINITNSSTIEEAYTFTSNNTSIATVSSSGLITATGTGDTTITVTGSTSSQTKTINIHVSADNNIVLFDPSSSAIKNYVANISEWSTLDETTFISAMQNNFETFNCKWNTESNYVSWASTWNKNGTVDCDRPNPYVTGANSSITVYIYNSETNHDYTNDSAVTYLYTTSSGEIYNMIPGETYHWVSDTDSTVNGNVRATNTYRTLYISNARNIRELGGLPVDTNNDGTIDGYTKYGMLFRGERLYGVNDHPYTGSGTNTNATELARLGAVYELDLRSSGEGQSDVTLATKQLKSITHYRPDTDGANIKAALRYAMNSVIAGDPVYFHCTYGADRTGTVAYLLEALLGVPYESRAEDYELSTFWGMVPRNRYFSIEG